MKEKSLRRWRIVTLITVTVAFLFAVIYAFSGYIVFGQQTEGTSYKNKIFIFLFFLSIIIIR